MLLLLSLFSNTALAESSWVTGAYGNNEDRSQTLSITDATSLTVSVTGNTEKNYDYIYIYDKDNNQLKRLHGNNLNETFTVDGDSIRARLTTDFSITRSGVTVSIADNSVKNTADNMLIRFTDTNQSQRNNNIYQLELAINQLVNTDEAISLTFVEYNSQFNITTIALSKAVEHDAIYRLVLEDYVAYSEPNVVFSVSTTNPNDPKYVSEQWHYKAFTDTSSGINLPQAWAITTGEVDNQEVKFNSTTNTLEPVGDIVVAVIDSGITEHVDLVDNILKDGNGNVYGYDFNDNDTDPVDNTRYHATHVAGTIAAASNNSQGVAGVNWQAKILPVRLVGEPGAGIIELMKSIIWAAGGHIEGNDRDGNPIADNLYPAKVINLSIQISLEDEDGKAVELACNNQYNSNDQEKSSIQYAIDIAKGLGATVVAASGNNNEQVGLRIPANCENVITVGATAKDGDRGLNPYIDANGVHFFHKGKRGSDFSNYGDMVDVSAPGVDITSTCLPFQVEKVVLIIKDGRAIGREDDLVKVWKCRNEQKHSDMNTYGKLNGTSMAAPHVAGVASLMLAQNPDLTPAQIELLIKKSINDFPSGSNCTSDKAKVVAGTKEYCGTGIIDAYQAVVNSQITLLTLGDSAIVNKSKHGQTLYKFKYLDADGYSGVKEYTINFNRTAGTTYLYIKKNGLPNANDSNSYDCEVTYNGHSENNDQTADDIDDCLKDIKLAYGDLLYVQAKASGSDVGNISITKTHQPLWSGNLDAGKGRTHAIRAGHGDGDLKAKFTLTEVTGDFMIKITKVIGSDNNERTLTSYETCVTNNQGSCSIEVIVQNGELVYFEVENIGTNNASYKVAVDAESSYEQIAEVMVKSGYNTSDNWWSYTHENVANASNGGRMVKAILSDFTDVNGNHISADLDLYTKLYATNDAITAKDITTARGDFDCRPYYAGNSVETCKTVYNKDSNNNIDEKVRIRVRGYYASRDADKTVKFKLTTKTSRRAAY